MPPYKIESTVPVRYHQALIEMYRRNLLKCTGLSDIPHHTSWGKQPRTEWETSRELANLFDVLHMDGKNGSLTPFFIFSGVLANGPKFFYPTAEQFEAAANVSVDIPFDMYRQPFESMVIVLSQETRDRSSQALEACADADIAKTAPRAVLLRYVPETCVLSTVDFGGVHGNTVSLTVSKNGCEDSMEIGLARRNPNCDPVLHEVCKNIERAAFNLCLLLTHFDFKSRPQDPVRRTKLLGMARRNDPNEQERARLLLAREPDIVEFKQEVRFWDEQTIPIPQTPADTFKFPNDSTIAVGPQGSSLTPGHAIRPHWRRGHWRRESGYREVVRIGGTPKRVFIRPILVNAKRFVGDLSKTEVDYVGRHK